MTQIAINKTPHIVLSLFFLPPGVVTVDWGGLTGLTEE